MSRAAALPLLSRLLAATAATAAHAWGPQAAAFPQQRLLLPSSASSSRSAISSSSGGGGRFGAAPLPPPQMAASPGAMRAAAAAVEGLPPVVCYHCPCPDGAFAALAAHAHFSRRGVAARYRPLLVFKDPSVEELGLSGREVVYFLDYTGPPGFVHAVAKHCAKVVVLDHHQTAVEKLLGAAAPAAPAPGAPAPPQPQPPQPPGPPLPGNVHALLDVSRSGARLALDYFGEEGLSPDLLRAFGYVQDADLWTWQLPGSKEFHAGLSSLGLEYDAVSNPDIFGQLLAIDVDGVVKTGAAVLGDQARAIAAAVEGAQQLRLGGALGGDRGWGHALGCVVSGELVGWRSALGNALAKRSVELGLAPVGVVAYVETGMAPGLIKVSLRSVDGWETTKVTEAFGGGGHRAASSCVTPIDDFESWKMG